VRLFYFTGDPLDDDDLVLKDKKAPASRKPSEPAAGARAQQHAAAKTSGQAPTLDIRNEGSDIEVGYGWYPTSTVMELHPTIPSLLHASRSVLQYSVENTIPQLDRNAGYL
jgi:hypothetical protein